VDLSHLKTFRLLACHKLENLQVKFGKLESLVELDLSKYSELGCLPYSIVDLSQLKTFRISKCHKLNVLPILLVFKAKVTYHYYVVPRQI
jgi:hypothetical protein